jgi:ribosomal protein S18 acetylase RimI-like enzyme
VISSTAIFAVADVEATIAFYKDVLGFDSSWTWDDPPTFGSASKGGVAVMFCLQPELASKVRGHQHWINVEEVDELYQFHRDRNAPIISEIKDQPWGAREYVVEDLNGYYLRFAGPPSGDAPKSKPFPQGVTIEQRVPTAEEYDLLAGQAFGNKTHVPGLLEATWNGLVALSPNGEPIGVLRIMRDAPAWFSIWDVAVHPDWQGRRIGTRMMKQALEMIRAASPGANVHLFTFKHAFYERLGFGKQTVSLIKV